MHKFAEQVRRQQQAPLLLTEEEDAPQAKSRRHLNRLVRLGGQVGGELAASLGEYFASRNVTNRCELYDKLERHKASERRDNLLPARSWRPRKTRAKTRTRFELDAQTSCGESLAKTTTTTTATTTSTRAQPAKLNQPQKRPSPQTTRTCGKKRKVSHLLANLLFGGGDKFGRRRSGLLLKLLKTPTVLAALFSLTLVFSLLVLYALSFYQHHHSQFGASQLPTAAAAGSGNNTNSGDKAALLAHHINSRQLGGADGDAAADNEAQGAAAKQATPTATSNATAALVQTECALVAGELEQGGAAAAFRGVAYASPPIGRRRWLKPRPIRSDPDACGGGAGGPSNERKPHCVQLSPITRQLSGAEDCLYLDIYAPTGALSGAAAARNKSSEKKEKAKPLLPVMFYIHGGFLVYGSASGADQVNWLRAGPSGRLAAELNVIFVAPNYRLQALGFLALAELADEQLRGAENPAAPSQLSEGNYGLWDQLAALDWVSRNIQAFGGDPNNVLVFGPDSASSLPLALLSRAPDAASGDELLRSGLRTMRSVWLTNPTVYYQVEYKAANRHFERLLRGQSKCFAGRPRLADGCGDGGGDGGGGGGGASCPKPRHEANETLGCLLGLSAEQVIRDYLGKDDAAFRLDDQSSLPIRNIFADQFVTLDGELVGESFPFPLATQSNCGGASGDRFGAGEAETATGAAAANYSDPNGRPDNCRGGGGQALPARRLLVGSSAQAVEYWPCPRNLHNWNWNDFRRYVGTSLNSFKQDETYEEARKMYEVPAAEPDTSRSSPAAAAADPIKTYLTMVSDIRQVCPINRLAASLAAPSRRNQVRRYIVEWRPSRQLAASIRRPANNCGFDEPQADGGKATDTARNGGAHLSHAFHYWDLLAFFGFGFDAELRPQEADFKFQREIRELVRQLLETPTAAANEADGGANQVKLTLFAADETRLDAVPSSNEEFRAKKCAMWQRFVKHSYAWLS